MNIMPFNSGKFEQSSMEPQTAPLINEAFPVDASASIQVGDFQLPVAPVNDEKGGKIADTVEEGFFKDDTTSIEANAVIGDQAQSLYAFLMAQPTEKPVEAINHRLTPALGEPALQVSIQQVTPVVSEQLVKLSSREGVVVNTAGVVPQQAPLTQLQKRELATKELSVVPQFFAKSLLESNTKPISATDLSHKIVGMVTDKLVQVEEHTLRQLSNIGELNNVGPDKVISWSPIKLKSSINEMGQQLHAVLRERLQVQVDSQIQQATIRLDPPSLGKLDIVVNLEAGRLNIQINSQHSDVQRALQQISHELRQQLSEQNFTQVNVQVSSNSSRQEQQGRHQREEEQIMQAQEFVEPQSEMRRDDSILTKV